MSHTTTARPIEITAHRGSSAQAPENTRAAFHLAVLDGCDAIELDVQTCADGTVVVMHDRDLRRVAGDPRRLEDLAWIELQRVDVGRGFQARFAGERIPTLSDVLAWARDRVKLNIELKYNRPDPALAPAVLGLLRAHCMLDQCVITSFNAAAMQAVRASEPAARTGLILTTPGPDVFGVAMDIVSVAKAAATPDFIRAAHHAGRAVHVWTVNEPATLQYLIEAGADNVITDQPDRLRGWLNKKLAKVGSRIV